MRRACLARALRSRRWRCTCTSRGACASAPTATSIPTRCAASCRRTRYLEALLQRSGARRRRSGRPRGAGACSSAAARRACSHREALGRLLQAARAARAGRADAEITLEANPGTIERGRFARISCRGHQPRLARRAELFDAQAAASRPHPRPARHAARPRSCTPPGLSNFNLDLMYALPGAGCGRGAGGHARPPSRSSRRTCRTTS